MENKTDLSHITSIEDAKNAIATWAISKVEATFIAKALNEINQEQHTETTLPQTAIDTLLDKYIDTPATDTEYEIFKNTFAHGWKTIEKKDLDLFVKAYLKSYEKNSLVNLKGILIYINKSTTSPEAKDDINHLRELIMKDINRIQWVLNKILRENIASWHIQMPKEKLDHHQKRAFLDTIEKQIPEIKNMYIWKLDPLIIDNNPYVALKKEYLMEADINAAHTTENQRLKK